MTMSISSAPAATASAHVGELHGERGAARREGGGDRGDLHAGAGDAPPWRWPPCRGRRRGRGRAGRRAVGRVRADRLGAERPDLARGVRAFQRRQVDHRDGEVDGVRLGGRLDGTGAERGGARLQADRVDAGQPVQEAAQRAVGRGDVGESVGCSGGHGHQTSISTRVAAVQPGGTVLVGGSAERGVGVRPGTAPAVGGGLRARARPGRPRCSTASRAAAGRTARAESGP